MDFKGQIVDGRLVVANKKAFAEFLAGFDEGQELILEVKKFNGQRTQRQNASLHLLFKWISAECIEKGIDMREVVSDEVQIQCTPENVKWMWKILQKGLFGTKSTKELKKTGEIEVVYDNFNRIISERTKGEITLPPFPSIKDIY